MTQTKQSKGENRNVQVQSVRARDVSAGTLKADSATIEAMPKLVLEAAGSDRVVGTAGISSAASSQTVTTTQVNSTSVILLGKEDNGNAADDGLVVQYGNIVDGVSFDITSSAAVTDAGGMGVSWMVVNRNA